MSESFHVNIKVEGHSGGGFFKNLTNFMYKEFLVAQEDIKKRLLYSAKEEHKYKHQTRNLRDSTKVKGELIKSKGIELYVDFKKAPYAGWIITGKRNDPRFGTVVGKNGADPFLDKAYEDNKEWIDTRIQQAVDNAVIQFNRIK